MDQVKLLENNWKTELESSNKKCREIEQEGEEKTKILESNIKNLNNEKEDILQQSKEKDDHIQKLG